MSLRGLLIALSVVLAGCDPTQLKVQSSAQDRPQGEVLPELSAVDHLGRRFSLTEAREQGPVIMIFYRGHW